MDPELAAEAYAMMVTPLEALGRRAIARRAEAMAAHW